MPTADDELLITLFNRNLYFSHPAAAAASPPTPPLTSPVAASFSISRHYHHSSHPPVQPPSPPATAIADDNEMADDASVQLLHEHHYHQQQQQQQQQQVKSSDREYAEYLMSSDLSSPNSLNELEIALAHGVITPVEYQRSLESYTHRSQLVDNARRHQEMMGSRALSENCSAMEMLSAAKRSGAPRKEWCNDYYGGDTSYEDEDELAPCAVYSGASGCRLVPFDY